MPFRNDYAIAYLSVRTFGETVLCQAKNDADGLKLFDISRFTRADLGGHLPMDVDLDPHTSQFTIISSNGVVSNFDFHEGRKHSNFVLSPTQTEISPLAPPFWRVSLTNKTGCLRASHRSVDYVDFRIRNDSTSIFSTRRTGDLITSVAPHTPGRRHSCYVVSTNELSHIDLRFSSRPVSSYIHGRRLDRSLSFDWVTIDGGAFGCLHSHRNGLISIYDVHDSYQSRLMEMPLSFPAIYGLNEPHLGHAFISSPTQKSSTSFLLYQLQCDGSLQSQRMIVGTLPCSIQEQLLQSTQGSISSIIDPRSSNNFDLSGVLEWCRSFGDPCRQSFFADSPEVHHHPSSLDPKSLSLSKHVLTV
jgi:hypothetical protein